MSRSWLRGRPRLAGEALAITAALVGSGRALDRGGLGTPADQRVGSWLAQRRTPLLDRVTWVVSTATDTPAAIGLACTVGGLLWWRRRDGRVAVAPLASITVETAVFVSAAALVGRARPDVPWLDKPAPTSSYPSGHTGAATAMYATLARLLPQGPGWSALSGAFRYVVPAAVAGSRVYRGMHHPSDVVAGVIVGQWSARATRRLLDAPAAPRR